VFFSQKTAGSGKSCFGQLGFDFFLCWQYTPALSWTETGHSALRNVSRGGLRDRLIARIARIGVLEYAAGCLLQFLLLLF